MITTQSIKELRELTGAGIMDCKRALQETEGNIDNATDILRKQGFDMAEKKAQREANQGLVEAYIHTGGRIGSLVEVNCESDFVAHTDE
ncbi:MAG: elongation factor Ts, partial [Dehalococcoidia bacterium]|nr:elongation factor Ts [Dehalococcoidia bacterium]